MLYLGGIVMRLMLKFVIPVEKGNQAAADGSMMQVIQELIGKLQPESTYFYLQEGKRAGTIIFKATDQSQMVVINEPLFAKLHAEIEIQPALDLEDLARAL
ncbi:hypothetical protein [Piscirickettsia salmonis]|uniref:hypothetical protein n=2 Tax=Piscirickettsia salmonis TaxID=1238 RepID=UPI001E65B3D7|nr:hypothetical protein [Piscirickettsia salmonis]